jgi:glutathione peroxidase-family protein
MHEIYSKYKSVYDIPIKSVDGEDNFLEKFKGKVLMFVNTTGHCGNATQWPIIEDIASHFDTEDFQVIYVPTNDFCGSVTFGEYKNGLKDGKHSQKYAYETYGIEGNFTELVSSRNEFWSDKNDVWDGENVQWKNEDNGAFPRVQVPRSDLYTFLTGREEDTLGGNFHKFIVNKKGLPVAHFMNHTLINYNNAELQSINKPNASEPITYEPRLFTDQQGMILATENITEKEYMIKVIDEIIKTGETTLAAYVYNVVSA